MEFTYQAYKDMIRLLQKGGYSFCSYHDWRNTERCVILRHDIDNSLEQAVKMAEIEAEMGVHSTFFALLRTDFYNVSSPKGQKAVQKILNLGHEIGLHFDEEAYEESCGPIEELIHKEADILSKICDVPVRTVSMHRPSKKTLEANLQIPGMVNSYGETFLHGFKYLSDSRRHWREDVLGIIKSGTYDRLHILTHAFWYHEENESMKDSLARFVHSANGERYDQLEENITDLSSVLGRGE